MDVLDYWIWEHASKYGMAKVLTSKFNGYFFLNND